VNAVRRQLTARGLARLLGDWQQGPGPVYAKLSRRLGQVLTDGRVAPGVRLPAERPLAAELGVSRTTIVRTYALLREQRLLESRRGAGSVSRLAPSSIARFTPWVGSTRLEGDALPLIDLTKAAPGADDRVIAALQEATDQVESLRGQDGYFALGLPSLRSAIAARYEARGVPTGPEQIMVTVGAQQAIDLLARTYIRSREAVVVESPTYPGAMDSLRLAGARMVSLDVSTQPWQLDDFESLIVQTGSRLAYLVPDFHNPTGRLLPDGERERLVGLCRKHGVTVIVDESLVEVALDPDPDARPMAAHDASSAVISIGSVSKPAWGGFRVGWIRASPHQIAALAATRTAADLGGPPIEQIAVATLLPELDALCSERRPILQAQRETLLAEVRRQLGWAIESPRGGLSAWAELPEGSSSLLADVAYRHGLLLIPGPRFSPDGTLDRFLRLPYGLPPTLIAAGVERLRYAWEALQGLGNGNREAAAGRLQVV
jgi:DNA-binding transcriptional MocR family regulator